MPICPHCHKESAEFYYMRDAKSNRRATYLNGDYKNREWWQCVYCKGNIHIIELPKEEIKMDDNMTVKITNIPDGYLVEFQTDKGKTYDKVIATTIQFENFCRHKGQFGGNLNDDLKKKGDE